MLAYDSAALDRRAVTMAAHAAERAGLISGEELSAIDSAYAADLHRPNIFIRIGIFLLTVVIVSLVFAFLCLLVSASSEAAIAAIALVFASVLYAILEWVVREKKQYHSGLDDALMWLAATSLLSAISILLPHVSAKSESLLILVFSAAFAWRFASATMTAAAFIALLCFVFFSLSSWGTIAKAVLPFVLMAISWLTYMIARKNIGLRALRHYHSCIFLLQALALLTLYTSVNFFVVSELSNRLFGVHVSDGASHPADVLFWLTTISIPPIYIVLGLRRKNSLQLRAGLILSAATVYTIHYYHQWVSPAQAAALAGAALCLVAYITSRYLRSPRHGITLQQQHEANKQLALEALVAAQAFHPHPQTDITQHAEFGGGSGGGGGASGNF